MRVFLSWSGDPSRRVAAILKDWLPSVIQALDTWVSTSDIEKGESWFGAISESLVKADGVGVFCLTPENLEAPWLAYEAGAIASADRGRVATFLFQVQPSAVKPPLGLFQATSASSKEDVYLLLKFLNGRIEKPLDEPRLIAAFDQNWQRLNESLLEIPCASSPAPKPEEDARILLNEILSVVRRIEKDGSVRLDPSTTNLGFGLAAGLESGLLASGRNIGIINSAMAPGLANTLDGR